MEERGKGEGRCPLPSRGAARAREAAARGERRRILRKRARDAKPNLGPSLRNHRPPKTPPPRPSTHTQEINDRTAAAVARAEHPAAQRAVTLLARRDVLDATLEYGALAATAASSPAVAEFLINVRSKTAALLDEWRDLLEVCEADAERELAAAEARAAAAEAGASIQRTGSAGPEFAAAARALAEEAARLLARVDAGPPPTTAKSAPAPTDAIAAISLARVKVPKVGSDARLDAVVAAPTSAPCSAPDSPLPATEAPHNLGPRALQDVLDDVLDAKHRADARAVKTGVTPPSLDAFLTSYLRARFGATSAAALEWRSAIDSALTTHAPAHPAAALFSAILTHDIDEGFWAEAGRLRSELTTAVRAAAGGDAAGAAPPPRVPTAAAAAALASVLPADVAAAAVTSLPSDTPDHAPAAVVRAGLAAAVSSRRSALAPVAAAFRAAGGAARGALAPRAFMTFCRDVAPGMPTRDVAALLDALAGGGDEVTFSAAAGALAGELERVRGGDEGTAAVAQQAVAV